MNDTPKIRFNEFTDEWKQCKLGDMLIQYTEITTENNQYPALTSSRKGIFFQTEYFAGHQIASENNTGYNIVPRGYFTYRHMSDDEIFYFNINNIVDFGIVSTLYPVFTTNDQLDSTYLQYQLNNGNEFRRYAVLQKQGGSRTYMYFNKLKNLHLTIPPEVKEQEQISRFFLNLDNLITLHQRKYEQMIHVKNSMLEKLFPHNGANVPEIRFKEFTGDWRRRKLGDVFEEYCEKHHEELPPLTIIQGKGTILRDEANRNLQYDKSALHNYKMVKKGDFIVHLRSFEGGLEKANSDGIISPAYYTFHGEETDTRFYYPYFRSHEFINVELSRHVYGIRDGRSIDISGMKTIMIPYTSIEEQRKIGDFLEGLDTLIELYQQEFVKLKQIKSACLDGMFI